MARGATKKPPRKVLALDPDRLGMLGGAFLACVVLSVWLFVFDTEVTEAVFRAAVVFVVAYAAFSLLVYTIRQVNQTELDRQREAERQELLKRKQQQPQQQESQEPPGDKQ